jgi:hypothetical protein
MPGVTDPEHWRRRAEEMRAQAAAVDEKRRSIMLRIAGDFELLAKRAQERRASKPLLKRNEKPGRF